jgi:dihydrofolate reductase
MRKIILLEHVSLDGFAADSNRDISWIKVDDEIFDIVDRMTDDADTALYGRITYEMMENYWPATGEKPDATRHDIEHSRWTNSVLKIVFSRTMNETSWKNTKIISKNIIEEMDKLKKRPGKNILLFGSPSIARFFMQHNLIDEYYININPILLGSGIPLFNNKIERIKLKILEAKTYKSGVVGLHYERIF